MEFIYPSFLYALGVLAIPLILHLFDLRRHKKVYFSNISFLKDVKQETRSRSRIKNLLVLLARMLALAFLVMAFAQPYLPSEEGQTVTGQKVISIYLDNSFSMDGVNEDGRLLDLAKKQAIGIANSYSSTDKFLLHTNKPGPADQRAITRNEFIEKVEKVETSPRSPKLSDIASRQLDILKGQEFPGKRAFLISDFQKSVTDPEQFPEDTTLSRFMVPIEPSAKPNLYIDSVWFKTPVRQVGQKEALTVRIQNTSDERMGNIPLELKVDGNKKAIGSFNINPNTYVDTSLFYTNSSKGIRHASVSISDQPITFDDDLFFSYRVADQIPVLKVSDESGLQSPSKRDYISPVFDEDEFFQYHTVTTTNIDYSTLGEHDLIILDRLQEISSGLRSELEKFVQNGGSLVVFPHAEISKGSYNQFLATVGANTITGKDTNDTEVRSINLEAPLFRNVFEEIPENIDLPKVQEHYNFSDNIRSGERPLLRFSDGSSFLGEYEFGSGKVYLSAVPSDNTSSNLVRHAIFVTSLLRIAEFSTPTGNLYHTIGNDQPIEIRNINLSGEEVFHLKAIHSAFDVIPEVQQTLGAIRLFVHDQVKEAGNYEVSYQQEGVKGVGFNYDRNESDPEAFTSSELKTKMEELGIEHTRVVDQKVEQMADGIEGFSEGTKLWVYCIILVLIFLAMEVLLLTLGNRQQKPVAQ